MLSGLHTEENKVPYVSPLRASWLREMQKPEMSQVHVLPSLEPRPRQRGACRLSSGQKVALP